MVNSIKITLGETGQTFLQSNKLPEKGTVDKQPAGLNFYEYSWNVRTPGQVVVNDKAYSFTIPYVLSITGTEDAAEIDQGIQKFSINAGITADDLIDHDKARVEFSGFLQKLKNSGWKTVIAYEDPRLAGEDAFKYYLEDKFYSLPLDYIPTLDEWMKIKTGSWHLYAGSNFLDVTIRRDSQRVNISEPGAYLISFNLLTSTQKAKNQFDAEEIGHWQELWVDKIKSLKKERYAKETELTQRGFTIYTEYEEPKIHAADPVEP